MPEPDALPAFDASYRLWSNLLARRARRLSRDLARSRVEEAFRQLCLEVGPSLGLEVGAHDAGFSRWLKATVPAARCLAFEANPFVHQRYADGLAAAGVDYRHLAISEVDGTVDLHIPRVFYNPEHDRHFRKERTSRMASLGDHRLAEQQESVAVPSMPLDAVVRQEADPTEGAVVVWIDVEGASQQVLASAHDLLGRAALVYIEVESEPLWEGQWLDVDVARFLADRGLVPLLRDIQRPGQYNVVYVRAELATRPRLARLCETTYRRDPAA